MRKMKKLLSLVLAMMLVLAMGSTVMAAPEDEGTITISNAISGQTYTIYKMFNFEKNGEVYNYTVASGWEDFVKNEGAAYVKVNTDGYVVWNNAATGSNTPTTEAFAKAALAYAKAHNLPGEGSKTAGGSATGSDVVTVEFTGLPLGYYLLDSTTGTLCSLDTTDNEVIVTEKNEKTTVEKEVEEISTGVGEILHYTATINVEEGSENYTLHDEMSTGLTFNNDVAVTLVSGSDESVVASENYTVKTSELAHSECTFEVVFNADYCKALVPGTKLVVTYSATVNEEAVVYDKVNNTAKVIYGENNNIETQPSTVETPLYDLDVEKIDGATKAHLAGAQFTLKKQGGADITFKQVTKAVQNGVTASELTEETFYEPATDEGASVTLEVDENGLLKIKGLSEGTYELTETLAPEGYNKLQNPIVVTISGDNQSVSITVENNTGAELPSTGGIGTTIFYVLGGILVIGAGIMLVVRKRMGSEK